MTDDIKHFGDALANDLRRAIAAYIDLVHYLHSQLANEACDGQRLFDEISLPARQWSALLAWYARLISNLDKAGALDTLAENDDPRGVTDLLHAVLESFAMLGYVGTRETLSSAPLVQPDDLERAFAGLSSK
jgi:hypothetical protein